MQGDQLGAFNTSGEKSQTQSSSSRGGEILGSRCILGTEPRSLEQNMVQDEKKIKKDSVLGFINGKDDYCHLQRRGKTGGGRSYFSKDWELSFGPGKFAMSSDI